jgi:beta-1,4-mannosyl-glycoprotein beta-1,4-N-acetylglucosaminyltransferase
VVDYFVLVEANVTHSGAEKPLYYRDHLRTLPQFAPYRDRIIDVAMRDLPVNASPMSRENIQRAGILRGLVAAAPDDWVLVSDLDEIPRPEGIVMAQGHTDASQFVFAQRLSYYAVNCISHEQPWMGTRMTRYRQLETPHDLRFTGGAIISGGGWHMSYLGGVGAIQEKIRAYLHQEFATPAILDADHIARAVADGTDLFGRAGAQYTIVPAADIMSDLPIPIGESPESYASWFAASKDADLTSKDAQQASIDVFGVQP